MQRALSRWLAAALFALGVAATSRAHADTQRCGAQGRTWIAVHADSVLESDVATHVVGELRTDLAAQDIDVCQSNGDGTPIARVSIVLANGAESVDIRIAVRDAVTAKDLSRTIDTSKIPPEGRALVIALATEELLRASWAELTLPSAPAPAIAVPPPVRRIVDTMHAEDLRAIAPRVSFDLGLAAVADVFTTGFTRFGADARVGLELGRRLALGAHGGFRRSPTVNAVDGAIDADTLLLGADFGVALLPRPRRVGLDVIARVDFARITFHGIPAGAATGSSATLTSVEGSFGLRGRVGITSSFDVFVAASGGFPIVSANARDGTTTVASTDGALVCASLGVSGHFR